MTHSQPRTTQSSAIASSAIIVAKNVEKWYSNNFHVLKGVSLTVNKGEVVVLMGPSGSGKSTFIRTFNGLEPYQKGSVEVDGVKISHDLKNIEAVRREVGMVFQQFNLFPHLTVMVCVTHEVGFAREVASRVIFLADGMLVEDTTPTEFFNHPKEERTKKFLAQILH